MGWTTLNGNMAKQPILFLVPFEWLPDYGTEVQSLKSRTQSGAGKEIEKRHENGERVPKGYAVLDAGQMHQIMRGLQDGLGLRASVHWKAEDVMERKKCSRAKAEDWLSENRKYIEDAMVQAGWSVIETL